DRVSARIGVPVAEPPQLRLAEQERVAPATHGRNKREDGTGRTSDLPNFMTLGEAAKYLNRPVETVAHWVHRCRLIDKYKVGVGRGRVMVKRADLDAMLQKVERRGSPREQARELLDAADRRAELRNQRRVARREAPRRATAKVIKFATPAPPGGSA